MNLYIKIDGIQVFFRSLDLWSHSLISLTHVRKHAKRKNNNNNKNDEDDEVVVVVVIVVDNDHDNDCGCGRWTSKLPWNETIPKVLQSCKHGLNIDMNRDVTFWLVLKQSGTTTDRIFSFFLNPPRFENYEKIVCMRTKTFSFATKSCLSIYRPSMHWAIC